MIAGWYHAGLLAALPWCVAWEPRWAPLIVGAAVLVHPAVRRSRAAEPWSSAVVLASSGLFLAVESGWRGPVGLWLAVAVVVALAARWLPRDGGGRPDAADLAAAVAWAVILAARPAAAAAGGWLAPALLLLAARQLGSTVAIPSEDAPAALGPPTREVRGTVSLRGVVAASSGLPTTVPIDLDLRAGESLAVLCDDPEAGQSIAEVLAGRSRPRAGEVLVDGVPLGPSDRLAAVVAPGEKFLAGGLDDNLAALCDEPPDRAARGAARDACGLAEVVAELGSRTLAADGSPLRPFHRLLVLAARVLVSPYRVVVVVDPAPWVDQRRRNLWRAALVRASVGRTSIWVTDDPELADRADYVHELVDGSLRTR